MSEVQTVCAAVHEIAHSKLHDYAKQQDSHPKDSSTEEIEALYPCFYNVDLLNYFP